MTESKQTDDDVTAIDEAGSMTAGPGEFLATTADKDDEGWDEAEAAVSHHEPAEDLASALEDFPSATAGAGDALRLTVDKPSHDA